MALFNPSDPRLKKAPGLSPSDEGRLNSPQRPYNDSMHYQEAPSRFEVHQPQQAISSNGVPQQAYPQSPPQWQGVPNQQPLPPVHTRQNQNTFSTPNATHTLSQNGQHGQGGYSTYPNTAYTSNSATQPQQNHKDVAGINSLLGSRQSGWSTGLFDCFAYVDTTCLVTYVFPCITYGKNYERITGEEGSFGVRTAMYCIIGTCCSTCLCLISAPTRTQLRSKYNLQDDPCDDCLVHFFFGACALCQEARELDIRESVAPVTHTQNCYQGPQQQRMVA